MQSLDFYIHNPGKLGLALLSKFGYLLTDKLYLKLRYFLVVGKKLHLKHPQTFNEKLQWLKLYDRRPEYTIMVDKVKAKGYVASMIGEEYIIPTLGVWKDPDDIDFDALPNQFVLKCNHSSGGLCICTNKRNLDIPKVKELLHKGLCDDYYLHGREWPYKDVPRRILAEKFMIDDNKKDKALLDYKFFCFDGRADNVMVCTERETGHPKFYHFDRDWHLLPYTQDSVEAPADFHMAKPKEMDNMFRLAELLSAGIPHIRVDFYIINHQIYFGELTFYQSSGFDLDFTEEADQKLGHLIHLP